ncbi:MAG: FtsW/RodA/SpoVE family cell cycle protein [Anaerolineales bacterium]
MRLETWRYFDYWLIGAVAVLVIFGIAMVDSAIAGNPELVEANAVGRQITFAVLGFVVVIIATMLDYHFWPTIGKVLYGVIFVMLALVTFGGEQAFGAGRWINIAGQVIQPSELAKITVIVLSADFFARNQDKMDQISTIIQSSLWMIVLVGLIIVQPDLSTSITLMVIWAAMLFGSGIKIRQVLLLGLIALIAMGVSYPFLADYQKARITNFLFTDEEARYGEEYNVNQALITIGSGGWLGQGYGQGSQVQLRFLKVRDTDFIFASISNELGFVGTSIMMGLLFFVIYRILYNARMARDTYGALVCYGVAALIAFHTIINIGMNLKLMPVTGLPLPFISRGGSALMSILLGIGLVESVAARQKIV